MDKWNDITVEPGMTLVTVTFPAEAGKPYVLQFKDSGGSKDIRIQAQVLEADGTILFSDTDFTLESRVIQPRSALTVKLVVDDIHVYGDPGDATFSLLCSEIPVFEETVWVDGELGAAREQWYRINNVDPGALYDVEWQDTWNGHGSSSAADLAVSAFQGTGVLFDRIGNGNNGFFIVPSSTDQIYIKLESNTVGVLYDSVYRLKIAKKEIVDLTVGAAHRDTFQEADARYYRMPVHAGTNYVFTCSNKTTDSSLSASPRVTGYSGLSEGQILFDIPSGGVPTNAYTPAEDGYLYIRVWVNSAQTGSYSLRGRILEPVALSENTWTEDYIYPQASLEYTLQVQAGSIYEVHIRDERTSDYTGRVLYGCAMGETPFFSPLLSDAWGSSLIPEQDGQIKVTISQDGIDTSSSGTFALRVRKIDPQVLEAGKMMPVEFTTAGFRWFSIPAKSGWQYAVEKTISTMDGGYHQLSVEFSGSCVPQENYAANNATILPFKATADGNIVLKVYPEIWHWDLSNWGSYTVGFNEFVPTELTQDIWTDGSAVYGQTNLYRMSVRAGECYEIATNTYYSGDGTKTSHYLYISASMGDTELLSPEGGSYTRPAVITPSRDGVLEIAAKARNNGWGTDNDVTYAIRVRHVVPESFPTGGWVDGTLAPGTPSWYRIPVNAGKEYRVFWNDSLELGSSKDAVLEVSAWLGPAQVFSRAQDGFTKYWSVIPTRDAYLYIQCMGTGTGSTFALKVLEVDIPVLVADTWMEGSIAGGSITANKAQYYLVDVPEGTRCTLQWDDCYDGTGSYSSNIFVSAFDEEQKYVDSVDSGYINAPQFSVNGLFIVQVRYSWGPTGTFALRYRTQ